MHKKTIANGVFLVEIPEAGLSVLCGCPENAVKFLFVSGDIAPRTVGDIEFESGPNAILLSDAPVQNGRFSNLAEFPVLQMLYRQGMLIPGHPGNTGIRPMIVGLRDQIEAQSRYIHLGNYGLSSIKELRAAGLSTTVANERIRMKLAFAFGRIKPTEELLDLRVVDKDAIELRNGAFLFRKGMNRYEFLFGGKTVEVDLNLPPGVSYSAPYELPKRKITRCGFIVYHLGEGDGWDPTRPCTGSLIAFRGRLYLVDAGPNILESLEALGLGVPDLAGIFQTHAHDDHFAGLTSLLQAEKRLAFFSTPPVRASVVRKLRALADLSEHSIEGFFDFRNLKEGTWNEVEGLFVMPQFSPHPVETDIFFFRAEGRQGMRSYAHLADITSFAVLDRMATDDPTGNGMSRSAVEAVKRVYLTPADTKKIDIGGGMIHGAAVDFRDDASGELLFSHTSLPLTGSELDLGRRPDFGEANVLIAAEDLSEAGKMAAERCIEEVAPGGGPANAREEAILARTVLFAPPLSAALLEEAAAAAESLFVKAGTVIERRSGIYAVASGNIVLESGNRLLHRIAAGGCFGEELVLIGYNHLFKCAAEKDTELLFIEAERFLDKPILLWRLHEALEKRIAELHALLPLEWTTEYAVNIASIDDAHRRIFELAQAAFLSYEEAGDTPHLRKSVREIASVVRTHLADEASLMKASAYPEAAAHLEEHQLLTASLASIKEPLPSIRSTHLISYLKHRLLVHVLILDRRLGEYLTGKGMR